MGVLRRLLGGLRRAGPTGEAGRDMRAPHMPAPPMRTPAMRAAPALHTVLTGVLLACVCVACGGEGQGGTSTLPPGTTSENQTTQSASAAPRYTVLTTAPLRPGQSGASGSTESTAPATGGESSPSAGQSASDSQTPATTHPTEPPSTSRTTGSSSTTAKTVALTLKGPHGSSALSLVELRALPATQGYGGWKNSLGNITGPRLYKGVALRTLMDLVGGGSAITVVAEDGYEQELTSAELNGTVAVYSPSTGEPTGSFTPPLTPVVAYEVNGSPLSKAGGGPLRIAFLSPAADQVTDSSLWVKFVSVLTVR